MTHASEEPLTIACSLTPAELSQIDAIASAAGQSRAEWLHGLIRTALSQHQREGMEQLAARVAQLEQQAAQVRSLEQRLTGLTQQVQRLSAAIALQAVQQPSFEPLAEPPAARSIAAEPYTYEDFEDEPDEILYDFLEPGMTP